MRTAIIAITFIWVGLVLGISFVEAPLKFQAPGITIPLGLGIGKLVFGALNKIEIVFALAVLFCFLSGKFSLKSNFLYPIIFLILFIQSIWLLPLLDTRVDLILAGKEVPDTHHHIFFIILEVIKLIGLLFAGIKFLKLKENC